MHAGIPVYLADWRHHLWKGDRDVHDSIVYLGRLDRQRHRFDFDVGAVGLDAGYATSGIAQGLEQRGILGVTGYRRPTPPRSGMMASKLFAYEAKLDGYRCPQGQLLAYATTDRTGYRHYKSAPAICRSCPLLASCRRREFIAMVGGAAAWPLKAQARRNILIGPQGDFHPGMLPAL